MIKAIIFDLWETLGTKNVGISKTFFEYFNIPQEKREIKEYEKAVQLEAWDSENNMVKSLLLNFNVEQTEENITWTRDLFREGIEKTSVFPGMLELLQSLKSNYKLALISNTTVFESVFLDKFEIRHLFDVISWSWEIGSLKPALEIFDLTLQRLGTLPEEAVFIDDGQKNLEVARSLGLQGILFEDVETLKKSLGKRGILFPQV